MMKLFFGLLVEGGLITPVSFILSMDPEAHSEAPFEHHSVKVYITWVAVRSDTPTSDKGVIAMLDDWSENTLV